MNGDRSEAEIRIERAFNALAPHLDVECPRDLSERVRHAVCAETRRQRTFGRLRAASPWLAAAAAALLVLGLRLPFVVESPPLEQYAAGHPDAFLEEWAEAGAEAGERLTMLIDQTWWPDDALSTDPDESAEEALYAFDETFEALQEAVGA
jgi:hypothetical protein